ncbi:GNAT family N-acetyltransferase [Actinospica durhamensis]|uniref:GNAT family N-acetyltransferase n=1 Tax=Actinospica durhamensis TaxID=1508375 RepID=A0A941EW02_9ACTN|nr:GNAT family N-acetyltransferase [Actinospica durhamensis]MBR7834949.1 GNAT family N-acetyltransferase [Actinospica durhamensis]
MDEDLERRPLVEADARAYVELLDALAADAGIDAWRSDEDGFRSLLRNPLGTPEFDGFQGVFDGDRLIGYGRLERRTSADPAHWMNTNGGVRPDYRGRGVGTELVRWLVDLAPRAHRHFFPGRPLELALRAPEADERARALFEAEGFTPLRYFTQMRLSQQTPTPSAEVPAGLELVPFHAGLAEPVRLEHNSSFQDHWRYIPHTAQTWQRLLRDAAHLRPELSFILRDAADGAVAGYLLAGANAAAERATGAKNVHLAIIGTAPAYRRRGAASALIGHAVAHARSQGYVTATLNVDADNRSGALGLYTRHGFAPVRTMVVYNRVLGAV